MKSRLASDSNINRKSFVGVVLVFGSAVAFAVLLGSGVAAAQSSGGLAVTKINSTPANPSVGQPVEVKATVKNTGSSGTVEIDEIRLRSHNPLVSYDSLKNVGELSSGEETTVSLMLEKAPEGSEQYTVKVIGNKLNSDGEGVSKITAKTSLIVATESAEPSVKLHLPTTVAGVPNIANVSIVNPTSQDMVDVEVSVNGSDDSKTLTSVNSGNSTVVPIKYTRDVEGRHGVHATVEYVLSGSPTRSTDGVTKIGNFTRLRRKVDVQSKVTNVNNGTQNTPRVEATVSNAGNSFIENVVVMARNNEGEVMAQERLGSIHHASDKSAVLDIPSKQTIDLNISTRYEIAGKRYQIHDSITYSPGTGGVVVTGVSSRAGQIQGTVGNTGSSKIEGVVVKIGSPGGEKKSSFVGEIDVGGSETFTVSPPRGGGSKMEVMVSYNAGGKQLNYTKTVSNPMSMGGPPASQQPGGSGSGSKSNSKLPLIQIVVSALILIVVIAVIYKGWIRKSPEGVDESDDVEDLLDEDEDSIFNDEDSKE